MKTFKLAAVVTAGALTTLAAVGPAGAVAGGPSVFSGVADAKILDLSITAPEALLAPLGLGGSLSQTVGTVSAELSSAGIAKAVSNLLSGDLMNQIITSEGGATTAHQAIAEQSIAGIVEVGAGIMDYTADPAQNLTRSVSELAHLKVTLAPIFDGALPVSAEVTDTLQGAVQDVTDVVNGLVGELNGVLDTVEQTIEDTVGQVIDIPDVLPAALPAIPDVTEVDLLSLSVMRAESVVTTVGDMVRSESRSLLADISILGGLVRVPALDFNVWAQTNGLPGGATAGGDVTTIAVILADEYEVGVFGNVLKVGDFELDLSNPELLGLPVDVLGPVTDLLAELLATVGLPNVVQSAVVTDIAADGSFAKASAAPAALAFAPLAAVTDLVAGLGVSINLGLMPVSASVAGAPAQVIPTAPVVPAPVPAPTPEQPNLPRTGAGAIFAALGTLALGGAGFLRKLS